MQHANFDKVIYESSQAVVSIVDRPGNRWGYPAKAAAESPWTGVKIAAKTSKVANIMV